MFKNSLHLIILIVFIIFIFILSSLNNRSKEKDALKDEYTQNVFLNRQNNSLKQSNDSLKEIINSIKNQLQKQDASKEDAFFYDRNEEFKGIKNPKKYLENALLETPHLIPAKGVLGGKMFFERTNTYGNGWITGIYSDGHIGGEAIYLYKVKKDKKIEFKLLYYRTN